MNAGQLKVNFGGLDAAAADIQSSANQIEGRLDQLESELAPLRSDWTGAASESYQQAKANAGRTPDDQVKLAYWCEAHGLTAERLKHLNETLNSGIALKRRIIEDLRPSSLSLVTVAGVSLGRLIGSKPPFKPK